MQRRSRLGRAFRWLGTGLGVLMMASTAADAADLKVVVTVKPIHSLVAAIMLGVGEPKLLIDGAASSHTYVLKPSDAKLLNGTDLIFQVSEVLEPFMTRIARSLPRSVRVVALQDTPGLKLYPQRSGGTFDEDVHAPAGEARGHDHGHQHGKSRQVNDGHIWLDPANARLIAGHVAEVLATEAPEHAERFRANFRALADRLDGLAAELERELSPLAGRPYVVFHDAYQYLERRYNLSPVGSVTISPDLMPSAKRLAGLRRKIAGLKATCVFAEPQFEPKLIATVIEGTGARMGRLDPLGAALPAGPGAYEALMRALAADLKACLEEPS